MDETAPGSPLSSYAWPGWRRGPIGLRLRLTLLVLAATLPLLALTLFLSWRAYQSERLEIEKHTVESARALALAVDRELAGVQSGLLALSLSPFLQTGDLAAFYTQAKQMIALEWADHVVLADLTGQQLMNTRRPYGEPLPRRANEEGIRKVIATRRPFVTDLYIGAVTKRPIVAVDVPVIRNGAVTYILSIGVPFARLQAVVTQQRLPPSWIVSVLDSSGTIVARSRGIDAALGKKAAPGLLAAMKFNAEGTVETETIEGLQVVAAFSRSGLSGWSAAIGVPSSELAAPLQRSLLIIGLTAAVLLLSSIGLAALIGRRIAQPIQALVEPALALGRGEPVTIPSLPLKEADQVGRAIETASALLDARAEQRNRAEAQLRESELRFRTLADNAPVMIWMSGPEVGGIYYNKVWLDFTGRTPAEEMGLGWLEGVHPDDKGGFENYKRSFAERRPYQMQYRLRRNDGAWRWVLDTGTPRFTADGAFAGYIGSCLDITETKEAEEALRESEARLRVSEERFRILSQSTMEGVEIHDNRTIVEANATFAAMFGYANDEVIGRSPFDFVAPRARDEAMRRAFAQSTEPYESIGLRKDGSTFPVQFWGRPIFYQGRTMRVGVVRDLTEAKQAAAALRHSELRYRTLVAASAAIVWTTDARGKFVSPQPSWEEFTGQLWPGYAENGWIEMVHPEDRTRSLQLWPECVANSTIYTRENRLWHAQSQSYRYVQTRAVPIRDADGAVLEWIGTIVDVNERRRAEDELRRLNDTLETRVAERTRELAEANERIRAEMLERLRIEEVLSQAQKMEAIGHMTGGVAHDFNNLLTVVVGNLEMIERSAFDERVKRLAGAALAAAGRGERLTQQLLAFARRQTLHPRVLDINRLIREFEPLLRRALGESIELQLDLAAEDAACRIDPSQFETALLNLVVNARDASPSGSKIVISCRKEVLKEGSSAYAPELGTGPFLAITVADQGSGIPPEVLPRVFEPFFTTKEVGKGSGLGLSQVYGFVRQSGGTIQIDSPPGGGTTVRIYLPASREAVLEDDVRRSESGPSLEGRSVLVVEDDEAVRKMAVENLVELGCTIHVATNAADALQILSNEPSIELLFTDIVMPRGMNGVALARAARRLRPELSILLTTGYSGEMARGPDGFKDSLPLLRKPYRRSELAAMIREALSAASAPALPKVPKQVLLVEDDPLVRWATAAMFEDLGHVVTQAATAGEGLAALQEARFDVLFTDVGLPDTNGILFAHEAVGRAPHLQVIVASGYEEGEAPAGTDARWVRLGKPYHAKDLQRALDSIGAGRA